MELALQAARQSTVLLRNEHGALPLEKPSKDTNTRIVVIGPSKCPWEPRS